MPRRKGGPKCLPAKSVENVQPRRPAPVRILGLGHRLLSVLENRVVVARSHLKKIEQARAARDRADQKLVEAMVAAQLSGETYRDIGDSAGYSHQRAHDLVKRWKTDHEEEA